MKENSWINPESSKLFQKSLFILHLGRVAIGLFCIGSYILKLGGWTGQIDNSNSKC